MRGFLWLVLTCCAIAWSQTPAFEAASLKLSADTGQRARMRGGPGTADAGQITYTNVRLQSVLLRAFGIEEYQLSGPDWLSTRRYDIVAKIPAIAGRDWNSWKRSAARQ